MKRAVNTTVIRRAYLSFNKVFFSFPFVYLLKRVKRFGIKVLNIKILQCGLKKISLTKLK